MKSSRMLILFAVAAANVLNATNLKSFLQGQLVDEKGQTILHKAAKNCTRLKYFNKKGREAIASELEAYSQSSDEDKKISEELYVKNIAMQDTPEKLLLLKQDKNGKTARDYAKEMYKLTRCRDCADMAFALEDLEEALLQGLGVHILNALEEISDKLEAQQPDLSEDGAQAQ